MKTVIKVFVVILSMLLVSGCSNEERYDAVEFEYNGHSYIGFRVHTWKSVAILGTVYNPDCKCYKEDK